MIYNINIFYNYMDAKRITVNFIFSPTNIGGILSSKVQTKGIDPVPIFLYSILNTVIISGLIFLLISYFSEKNLALLGIAGYLVITFLLGIIVGTVDQILD